MKKYSKCAIYTLEKIEFGEGQSFYNATLVENTYNPKIPYGNKWEMTFYKCQIYTDLELEIANFDLELDKNKYSFVNISNPQRSIIRVLDFEYVNRTMWRGKTQLKNEVGKPKVNQYIAINKCEYNTDNFKTEERQISDYEKRLQHQKEVNAELRKKIKQLEKQIIKQDEEILDKNEKINNVEVTYNPKYKPEDELITKDSMITFDDI